MPVPAPMEGKVVLITGGNTGIGRATAFDLASQGAEVLIASRTEETCKKTVEDIKIMTKNEKVSYFLLDLSSFKSISDFVNSFANKHKHLDVMVLNAGAVNPPEEETAQGVEATVGINYLGHFYLTKLLGELLIKSKTKVIVVSCEAHRLGDITPEMLEAGEGLPPFMRVPETKNIQSFWKQYGYSNRARIYFAKELSARHPEITAVSLHPGNVKTQLGRNMPCIAKCLSLPFHIFLKTPEQGAATTIHCVTEDMSGNRGDYFIDSKVAELKSEWIVEDIQKKLWDVTDKVCNEAKH